MACAPLALARELHDSVNDNRARAGLLVADIFHGNVAMENFLLEATGDALDIHLLDARLAAVVGVLPVALQAREDVLLQELLSELGEILGPVLGNERLAALRAADVLIGERASERG